nr:HAD hydrolase-like protein [uncultured Desulfobacter sp.]
MNRLIIFDLDGTLADTRADLGRAVNWVRTSYGLPEFSMDTIIGYVGGGRTQLMEKSLHDMPDKDITDACNRFTHYYAKNLVVDTRLYDGVSDTLKALRRKGFFLAVLSNKPGDMSRQITALLGLDQYLVTTLGGGDVATVKPEPEGFYEVLKVAREKGFNANKENIWMVGDHHTDLQLAHNVGIRSIFCKFGFGTRLEMKPDFEIERFKEIKSIII